MLKHIFTAVQNRITEAVSQVQYVGEDWGQLDFYAERPPVRFPCVLFDVDEVKFAGRGRVKIQDAAAVITLRIADYRAVNVSALSGIDSPALDMYDLLTDIYKALEGLGDETFSGLTRKQLVRVRRDDGIREYRMTFASGYVDDSAADNCIPIKPDLKIDIKNT